MKCDDVKKRIMENNIDNSVWKHIKECKECMSFMEIYTELNAVKEIKVPQIEKVKQDKKFNIKKMLRMVSVAAIFVALVGLSSLWIHNRIKLNNMKNRIDEIAMDINEDNSFFIYGDY